MPPKKHKVKVSTKSEKASKGGSKQGVKINIHIDQSKKTKSGLPKAPVQRRALPAFSAMPQGPSYIGAQYPTRQDFPVTLAKGSEAIDYQKLGNTIFNQMLSEQQRRDQAAYGFGGFQTAGQQANQLFEGVYRTGVRNEPIILDDAPSQEQNAIDYAVYDDPTTNQLIATNKLENRGPQLPQIGENSRTELLQEERRDNQLDNLVLQQQKSATAKQVEQTLDEDLKEEEDEAPEEKKLLDLGGAAFKEASPHYESDADRALREENITSEIEKLVPAKLRLGPSVYLTLKIKPPKKTESEAVLQKFISDLNEKFGTNYPTDIPTKGRLNRIINAALLIEFDQRQRDINV